MLVISRKVSESVVIGGNIEVMVSEITSDRVKICIKAPKEIPITRRELLETSSMNREASAAFTGDQLSALKGRLGEKHEK